MGLAIIDMTTGKSVTGTITYTYTGGTAYSTSSSGTSTIYPYQSFNSASGYVVPLNATASSNTNCYYVVKATGASASTSIKIGCGTTAAKEYWSDVAISGIGYGKCTTSVITSNRTFANYIGLFPYKGQYQQVTLPWYGSYKMECWGARGGLDEDTQGGLGAYVRGNITLNAGKILYVYIGRIGKDYQTGATKNTTVWWNPQLVGINYGGCSTGACQGGGASDIRYTYGDWNNSTSIASRIIVAGGGGGSENGGKTGGAAGGLRGYSSSGGYAGGTQTSGYGKGVAEYNWTNRYTYDTLQGDMRWGGGGNGYYSGYSATDGNGGGGGSSYISGHPGCTSISGYTFSSTKMIDGSGKLWTTSSQTTGGSKEQMPKPSGGYYSSGVGHSSDGYAKITSQ